MNRPNPYTYEDNCPRERVEELFDCLSPIETLPPQLTKADFTDLVMERTDARYAVLIDGRLAGICFVNDLPGRREMAFTKTEYLTTSRKLTFARTIPLLFADLDAHERRRLGDAKADAYPMYMHTPDGDDRSRDWFIAAGCTEGEHGLLCPTKERT